MPQHLAEHTAQAQQRILRLAEQPERLPIFDEAVQAVRQQVAAGKRAEKRRVWWETWRPIIRLLSTATLLLGAAVIAGLIWTGA